MIVTNKTSFDIYFGPLHLGAGVGTTLTVDDTSATSLYLIDDSVADSLNNAYISGQVAVSDAADPFPRPTGDPRLLHGSGIPEGLVYAPQGSVYMRKDGVQSNGGVLYMKTTGITINTGWLDLATASGATAVLPSGVMIAFAGAATPSGWLICDGSAISRETYSLLFAAIGTVYGAGDGTTTFNLPNLKGKVVVALDGDETEFSTLGQSGGETTHTLATTEMPSHTHGVTDPQHSHALPGSIPQRTPGGHEDFESGAAFTEPALTTNNAATGISIQNAGGDTAHNNLQPYLVMNYIIKT